MTIGLMSAMLAKGASYAPQRPRHTKQQVKAAEQARKDWLNALMVDQTRAWLEIGDEAPDLVSAFAVLLTLGGFVIVYETKSADTPALRIIRGAISAAEQCSRNNCKISKEHAIAFNVAAAQASEAIKGASIDAIIHAAISIRSTIGMDEGS